MKNELEMVREIDHPNIVKIKELLNDNTHYYIVQEFMKHGTLFDFVKKRNESDDGPLLEEEIKTIAVISFHQLQQIIIPCFLWHNFA